MHSNLNIIAYESCFLPNCDQKSTISNIVIFFKISLSCRTFNADIYIVLIFLNSLNKVGMFCRLLKSDCSFNFIIYIIYRLHSFYRHHIVKYKFTYFYATRC